MTVKELKDFLKDYPDDMEILETRCSDYGPMEIDDWEIVEARRMVGGRYGWYQRKYENGTLSNNYYKSKTPISEFKKYLHFKGN